MLIDSCEYMYFGLQIHMHLIHAEQFCRIHILCIHSRIRSLVSSNILRSNLQDIYFTNTWNLLWPCFIIDVILCVWKGNAECLFVFLFVVRACFQSARLREKPTTIEFSRYVVTRNVYELPLARIHLHARRASCSDIPDNDERDANDRCMLVKAGSLSRNVYDRLNCIQSFVPVERDRRLYRE